MRVTLRAAALLLTTSSGAFAGGTIGYAQATGYYKQDTRPTLYQPLNLLDAREATAWCSPNNDPLNELLTFGFSGPVKLEELKVFTGNRFDQQTFTEFARAKKLKISSGKQSQTISLEDQKEPQSIAISPPMVGERFRVEVLDQYPGEDLDAPVCLSDLVFTVDGKQVNGPWLTTKLKYDKNIASVLGTWFSGFDKTPDGYLSFNFDGTFRYSFEPHEKTLTKPKVIEGTYDITGSKLTLEIGGKKSVLKYLREGEKQQSTLTLDGDLPAELKVKFRNSP